MNLRRAGLESAALAGLSYAPLTRPLCHLPTVICHGFFTSGSTGRRPTTLPCEHLGLRGEHHPVPHGGVKGIGSLPPVRRAHTLLRASREVKLRATSSRAGQAAPMPVRRSVGRAGGAVGGVAAGRCQAGLRASMRNRAVWAMNGPSLWIWSCSCRSRFRYWSTVNPGTIQITFRRK